LKPGLFWAIGLLLTCALGAGAQWREISAREADERKVESIDFVHRGQKTIKNKTLRAAMRTQEGERFRRRLFKDDLSAVINLYRSRGYREAQILRKRFYLDEKDRVRITVEIDKSALWIARKLRVEGGQPFAAVELLRQVPLNENDPLDYGRVLEGERALQIYLNRRGYAHAQVRNEWIDEDSRTHSAEVVYHVNAGPKMFFGEVLIENEEQLHTRPSLVRNYLTFARGDLYDPEKLAQSRNLLARTDLFRSVFLSTPSSAVGDSLQVVRVQLQERKYISLGANVFLNSTENSVEPRLTGNVQHHNWLGRGSGLGLNASWGEPLQGATLFFTERDLLRSGADLLFSVGFTDEWSRKEVFGDPSDVRQFELLTANDSVLNGLLLFGGEAAADEYINTVTYDYRSLERLWEVTGALSRSWRAVYQAQFAVSWSRARNKPDGERSISYAPSDVEVENGDAADDVDDLFGDDDFFGDSDDLFGDDDFFDDGELDEDGTEEADVALDYFDGSIPVDSIWEAILTERSRTVNFTTEFLRDTRDDRIAPTRGSLLRLSGLYAVKLGKSSTYVLDGEAELRGYQRLSRHLVAAVALQGTRTASLRDGRALPQIYWKEYGGEGSLRGVDRNAIQAAGGGRVGFNARAELRLQHAAFGLVAFWDRAQVWRQTRDIEISELFKAKGMVDGYGAGLRYTFGFPFRLDLAFNDGFDRGSNKRLYFSIGQAF